MPAPMTQTSASRSAFSGRSGVLSTLAIHAEVDSPERRPCVSSSQAAVSRVCGMARLRPSTERDLPFHLQIGERCCGVAANGDADGMLLRTHGTPPAGAAQAQTG